jgi:hypothetical protein
MKRTLVGFALLLSVLVNTASAATAAPYFETGTDGLPVSLITGEWVQSDENGYTLELDGTHAVAARSWFRAGWTSPWIDGPEAEFEMSYQFSSANAGKKLIYGSAVRTQRRGQPWSAWSKHPGMPYEDMFTSWGGGTGVISIGGSAIRFQWKARASVEDASIVNGSIDVWAGPYVR